MQNHNAFDVLREPEKKKGRANAGTATQTLVSFTAPTLLPTGRSANMISKDQVLKNLFAHASAANEFLEQKKNETFSEHLLLEMKYYLIGFVARLHDLKLPKPVPMSKQYFKMIKKSQDQHNKYDIITTTRHVIVHQLQSQITEKDDVTSQFNFYKTMLLKLKNTCGFYDKHTISLVDSILRNSLNPISFDDVYENDPYYKTISTRYMVQRAIIDSDSDESNPHEIEWGAEAKATLKKQIDWIYEFTKETKSGEPDKALLVAIAEVGEFFMQFPSRVLAEKGELSIDGKHYFASLNIDEFVSVRKTIYHPGCNSLNIQAVENCVNLVRSMYPKNVTSKNVNKK